MKRILFLHSIFNTPYKHEFYNLISLQYEVHVIQLAYKSKIRDWAEIKDKRYFEYIISPGLIEYRNRLVSIWKIYQIIKRIDPEVIIVHGYNRIEYLLIPFFFFSKIRICEIATTYKDKRRIYWKEQFKSFMLEKLFNYFLVYGQLSYEYLTGNLRIPESKVRMRGNFSHLQLFQYNEKLIDQRENILLYVGRLSDEKNLNFLINTFAEFTRRVEKSFKLVLIGDGPLKSELKELIEINELQESVELLGNLPQTQLINHYLSAKAFVLPSISEPWGQVVNEAMHFGLPVFISKNCGSAVDLCSDENALIFDPKDEKGFLKMLLEAFSDPVRLQNMGIASKRIIENHAPSKLVNNFVSFMNKVLFSSKINFPNRNG